MTDFPRRYRRNRLSPRRFGPKFILVSSQRSLDNGPIHLASGISVVYAEDDDVWVSGGTLKYYRVVDTVTIPDKMLVRVREIVDG